MIQASKFLLISYNTGYLQFYGKCAMYYDTVLYCNVYCLIDHASLQDFKILINFENDD